MRRVLFNLEAYEAEPDFADDDWETPDGTNGSQPVAQAFAALLQPHQRVLDCSAGSGRMAQFYPPNVRCLEINSKRVEKGRDRAPQCQWECSNFLKRLPAAEAEKVDAVISNVPFSLGVEFLAHSRHWLTPTGYVLFLLPVAFWSTKGRSTQLQEMNAVIQHTYLFQGRVSYLRGDAPFKQRQVDDAVFQIGFWGTSSTSYLGA